MNFRLQTLLRAGPEALLGAARTRMANNAPSMRVLPYPKKIVGYKVSRQNPALAPGFKPKGVK